MKGLCLVFFILAISVYGRAEGPEASATPSPSIPEVAAGDEAPPAVSNPLSGIIEDYSYTPKGKRDPFSPFDPNVGDAPTLGPMFPLQKYDLDQLRLVGVIWGVKSPKALIMDPNKNSHVAKLNDRIGRNNGYIARIREGEIVIVETYKDKGRVSYQTQVMKLEN